MSAFGLPCILVPPYTQSSNEIFASVMTTSSKICDLKQQSFFPSQVLRPESEVKVPAKCLGKIPSGLFPLLVAPGSVVLIPQLVVAVLTAASVGHTPSFSLLLRDFYISAPPSFLL